MNLYFVLEGDRTEPKVFPKWLEIVLPHYNQVFLENKAVDNNYYMFNGGGIPSIYNHTVNAIKNINDTKLYDKLIICLDGEEIGVEERKLELLSYIEDSEVKLSNFCELHIIVQEVCIETWFLGNRKIVTRNPQSQKLIEYIDYFNVRLEDPELMSLIPNSYRTRAQFHYSYFREVLKEKKISYRKNSSDVVQKKTYFKELVSRISETEHLRSFNTFYNLLLEIKKIKS